MALCPFVKVCTTVVLSTMPVAWGLWLILRGVKSRKVVTKALEALAHMEHRAAHGDVENAGDGAGIMTQIPHDFFAKKAQAQSASLPPVGRYAVGMIFPSDTLLRSNAQKLLQGALEAQGLSVLFWRHVPVNADSLTEEGRNTTPVKN